MKPPITRKGMDIAMLQGMDKNLGNPRKRSIKNDPRISINTMLKNTRANSGVRRRLYRFEPVTTPYIKPIIFSRIAIIFFRWSLVPLYQKGERVLIAILPHHTVAGKAEIIAVADDEVIKHFDVHELSGGVQFLRELFIFRAGGDVGTGMIVNTDNRRREF